MRHVIDDFLDVQQRSKFSNFFWKESCHQMRVFLYLYVLPTLCSVNMREPIEAEPAKTILHLIWYTRWEGIYALVEKDTDDAKLT